MRSTRVALRALAVWALPAVGLDSGVLFQAHALEGLAWEGGSVVEDASASASLAKDGSWIIDEAMMSSILQGLSEVQDTAQRHAHVLAQTTGYNFSEGQVKGALGEVERLRELLQGASGAEFLDNLRELQAKVMATANRPDVREAMQAVAGVTLRDPETPTNTTLPASQQETRARVEELELWARRQAKAPAVTRAREVIAGTTEDSAARQGGDTNTDEANPGSDEPDNRKVITMSLSTGFTGGIFPANGSGTYCEFRLPLQGAAVIKKGNGEIPGGGFGEIRGQESYQVGTTLGSGHAFTFALTESKGSREFATIFHWPSRIAGNGPGNWTAPANYNMLRVGSITQASFGFGANYRFNFGAYWMWTWSFNRTGHLDSNGSHVLTFTVDVGVGPATLGLEFAINFPWEYGGGAVYFSNEVEQESSLMSILDEIYRDFGDSKGAHLSATGRPAGSKKSLQSLFNIIGGKTLIGN